VKAHRYEPEHDKIPVWCFAARNQGIRFGCMGDNVMFSEEELGNIFPTISLREARTIP
jgi:hypothetical protein